MEWVVENDPRLPNWLNTLLNWPPFLLPTYVIAPVIMFTSGYISAETGKWVWIDFTNQYPQMFRNGMFCIRFMLPFCICLQVRWSADASPSYFQTIIGWKLNGRFGLSFRFEDDPSAAAGVLQVNTDQASGWNEGGK
jgi:hypothetical protein